MKTTKHSRKFLTETLKAMSDKNSFGVNVVEPGTGVKVWDMRWSGGTRNEYFLYSIADDAVSRLQEVADGSVMMIPEGFALIQTGVFAGKVCGLSFTMVSEDVAGFFGGVGCPRLPAEVAADWLQVEDVPQGASCGRGTMPGCFGSGYGVNNRAAGTESPRLHS